MIFTIPRHNENWNAATAAAAAARLQLLEVFRI